MTAVSNSYDNNDFTKYFNYFNSSSPNISLLPAELHDLSAQLTAGWRCGDLEMWCTWFSCSSLLLILLLCLCQVLSNLLAEI